MVSIVRVSPTAMRSAMFGDNSDVVSEYLDEQIQSFGRYGRGSENRLMSSLRESYDYINDMSRRYRVRDELERENLDRDHYDIRPVRTFDGFRKLNAVMQRWTLANPVVRRLYLDQDIEGYADSYVNLHGNDIGIDHKDYRMVTDGCYVESDDPDEDDGMYLIYEEDWDEFDVPPDNFEKMIIMESWDVMNHILRTCDYDPTSTGKNPSKRNV